VPKCTDRKMVVAMLACRYKGDPGHCAGINKRTQRKESMEGKTREKGNEMINVKSEQKECNASALLPSRRTFCVPSATTSSRTPSRRRMGTHTTARPSWAGVEKKVLATEVGALYAQRRPQNAKCQRCRKDIRPMFIERHSQECQLQPPHNNRTAQQNFWQGY